MTRMIDFYNQETERYQASPQTEKIESFANSDPKKISWHSSTYPKAAKGRLGHYNSDLRTLSEYRPFQRQWLYYDPMFVQRVARIPRMFPTSSQRNKVLWVTGVGANMEFSCYISSEIPDLQGPAKIQCFPLKLYEPASADDGLFATGETGYTERDGISDVGLKHFQDAYPGEQISKEDLFYYIYGLLHSPDYRTRFKNNLSKELPRIPAVKAAADFWAFSKAGRALGDLHVNYETVDPYPVVIREGDLRLADIPDAQAFYRVEKMKFGGKGKAKDKTIVHYNPRITMTGIPLAAYDYVVNGKPALDWVVERQCVKTDKASGIVNDANRYANETVGNPAYPLELFQRVITVSLETMKIVNGLPALDID